jgi:hypothetical protein
MAHPEVSPFDDKTRNILSEKLIEAMKKTFPDRPPEYNDFEISIILKILEGYAYGIIRYQQIEPEGQQRRRERIESLAAHIEGAIEQLKQLDSAALGFVAWRGFEEISTAEGLPNEFPSGDAATCEVYFWRESNISAMSNFALGVRKAAAELPQHAMNTSGKDLPWWSLPKELSTAMAVEKLFWDERLEFTISNNGLAAECLRAVYQLGGLNIDRVDYWLEKARDHFDSMTSIVSRLRKCKEE